MAEPNTEPKPNEPTPTEPKPAEPKPNEPKPIEIDYQKLADLINGKQTVTEDTVLKNYFKQQGLSQEEVKQAIATFKEQKAKNTPNFEQMQNDLTTANNARLTAEVNQLATVEAVKLGVDIAKVPYILKLADFADATADGKIDGEKLTSAIQKVLDEVPEFKKQNDNGTNGVHKIGGNGEGTEPRQRQKTVPTKKWNKFNY